MACCKTTTTTTTVTTVERCPCLPPFEGFKWGGWPQRINGGQDHEPTPYCSGVGCKRETHEHPGTIVKSLEHGHDLGKTGLKWLFPVGSEWYYGSIYENMETRIRVTEGPKHSGSGRTLLRDGNLPERPATWFIYGEVVSSPHQTPGYRSGWPPHTLIPASVVERERGIVRCCDCDTSSLERKLAQAQREIEGLRRGLAEADDQIVRERSDRRKAQARLLRVMS